MTTYESYSKDGKHKKAYNSCKTTYFLPHKNTLKKYTLVCSPQNKEISLDENIAIISKDGSTTVRYDQNLRTSYLAPSAVRTRVPYFSSIFEAYHTDVPYQGTVRFSAYRSFNQSG